MVQVEVGRRPRPARKQRRRFPGFMTGALLSHRDVSVPSAGRWRCLEIIYRHDGADGGGTASCSAHSETSLRQSELSLIWLLIGQKHETVCWLREKKRERAETNAGQRFSDGVTNLVS